CRQPVAHHWLAHLTGQGFQFFDRYPLVLESGRQETIGGGEVLDIAPKLRLSKAKPDRSISRVVREHKWITVEELEALTGQVSEPMVGNWLTTPELLDATRKDLAVRLVKTSEPLELARLKPNEQAVIATLPNVVVEMGFARIKDATSIVEHPYVALFL
ncbi:MAG: hypothetical protein ACKOFM_01690, partial [Actinomycetota bacterium]